MTAHFKVDFQVGIFFISAHLESFKKLISEKLIKWFPFDSKLQNKK
jgi:hypothetical protein